MRQFRTSTDSVFDIADLDEGTRDLTVVSQAGPPALETTGTQPELPTADPAAG
jgi:hypothetical protein